MPSDPVRYTCTCPARASGGSVLLFYRYYSNDPQLPLEHSTSAAQPEALAHWHRDLTTKYDLRGKLRIAKEGFNITVGGTNAQIKAYMEACCEHWSFGGLYLDAKETRLLFFKPTPGCACVFAQEAEANIRVCAEITPMGVQDYNPQDWAGVKSLSPEEFHRRCHEGNVQLLDVRNHYESRIGYFISPETGEPALRPPIRRFSQWPQYLKHHPEITGEESRQIISYCTGGIRCEKGVRWMHDSLPPRSCEKIYTLAGGIAAYLTWIDTEIQAGRKQPSDSLFRGRNYVFDGRGSTGLQYASTEPVSQCHICAVPTDHLSKCHSQGCHLVLVVCESCDKKDPRCCQSCQNLDLEKPDVNTHGPRPMCACEEAREAALWGRGRVKHSKSRRRKKGKEKVRGKDDINIQVYNIQQ